MSIADGEYLAVLRERATYLRGRIEAKKVVGWEYQWDERERAALLWAIEQLQSILPETDNGMFCRSR